MSNDCDQILQDALLLCTSTMQVTESARRAQARTDWIILHKIPPSNTHRDDTLQSAGAGLSPSPVTAAQKDFIDLEASIGGWGFICRFKRMHGHLQAYVWTTQPSHSDECFLAENKLLSSDAFVMTNQSNSRAGTERVYKSKKNSGTFTRKLLN